MLVQVFKERTLRKRVGNLPDTSGTRNSTFTLFRSLKGIEPRPRSPIVDIEQDEDLDSSIVHLHHDPPSTLNGNKEGLRPYLEKPSQAPGEW